MNKSLDIKLDRILADPSCGDFILADAKDGDMAYGAVGLGPRRYGPDGPSKEVRSVEDYRDEIRRNVEQGLVDIMLMSASSSEVLTIREARFRDSHITPACRSNDTTDIHLAAGGVYPSLPSRPFRSATLDHIMYGRLLDDDERKSAPVVGADLGLYSITFNNDMERDLEALERYRSFRIEAERHGFRHFLEIFSPNACEEHCPADLGRYMNDMIVRTLAGVVSSSRPVFLKVPYLGPAAMEELAAYDRAMVPGILGGASGTTYDAFKQLADARRYGARVALYGRMINNAEDQRAMIQHLRWIADGQITDAAEAVRSYHGELQRRGVKPTRSLEDDLKATLRQTAYSGTSGGGATAAMSDGGAAGGDTNGESPQKASNGAIESKDKVADTLDRWGRILG